jgi:hypothetical protein
MATPPPLKHRDLFPKLKVGAAAASGANSSVVLYNLATAARGITRPSRGLAGRHAAACRPIPWPSGDRVPSGRGRSRRHRGPPRRFAIAAKNGSL